MKLTNNEFWFIISLPEDPGDEPVVDSIWETEEEAKNYVKENNFTNYKIIKDIMDIAFI